MVNSMCTCGHVGDGLNTYHTDTVQPGHGKCKIDDCDCEKFTYDGIVVEWTETQEKIWWRKVKCPKCGEEKDDLEVMPETGDFGIIDEGLKVTCECGAEFRVIEPQPDRRCIHCGSEEVGRNAFVTATVDISIRTGKEDPTEADIMESFCNYERKMLGEMVKDAANSDSATVTIESEDICFECDKYQTPDGTMTNEAMTEVEKPKLPKTPPLKTMEMKVYKEE